MRIFKCHNCGKDTAFEPTPPTVDIADAILMLAAVWMEKQEGGAVGAMDIYDAYRVHIFAQKEKASE